MRKLLIILSLLVWSFSSIKAQENLWPNPGFEETEEYWGEMKFVRWAMGARAITEFNFAKEAHSGNRALIIYPTAVQSLNIFDEKEEEIQSYPCKVGDRFTLSYWHKGDLDIETLEVTIRLYDADNKINPFLEKRLPGSKVLTKPDWTEHKVSFTIQASDIPAEKKLDHFDVILTTSNKFNSPQYIIVDDFKLVAESTTPDLILDAPVFEEVRTYEHEIELAWQGHEDNTVSWEVVINDEAPIPTTTPEYLMYGLDEGTDFKVKVCAVKGNVKSPFSEEKVVRTKPIAKGKDDVDRLPHLRTLAPDGSVQKQSIELFYNDLYNHKDAIITYTVDGNPIAPDGCILKLPKKGTQVLEIRIEESPTHIWELIYQLNVFN